MRLLAILAVAALVCAAPVAQAADNIAGEWQSADGVFKFEFQGKGKCYFSAGAMTTECTYTQNGKQTIVKIPDEDPLVLTANDDGSMSTPKDSSMPMRFKKKKQ